jgi:hypothetical protein
MIELYMSLDKSIKSGKEWRKPYYDSRSYDHGCHNNNCCKVCLSSRMHAINKNIAKAEYREEDDYRLHK